MSHFPSDSQIQDNLYDVDTVREIDQAAITELNNEGIRLMKRAGVAAFEESVEAFGHPSLMTVFCGAGNNAGDGYILAARAAQKRMPVQIVELSESKKFSPETGWARQYAKENNVPFIDFSNALEINEGVIIDCLLGIGYRGPLRAPYGQAIDLINHAELPVLSIDIPSGLNSDTGSVQDNAVKAEVTVTFVAAKQGLFTGKGPALCGEVIYHSLDIPEHLFSKFQPSAQLMNLSDLLELIPQLEGDEYKNQRGHCMVVGGDHGYGGAATMAAEASLRVGSGLTSVATQPEHVSSVLARCPEIMACGVISGQQLEPWLEKPSVLVAGPGLGRSAWSEQLLQKAVASTLPMVLDADALNILAEGRVIKEKAKSQWVLTPHVGEAARLLGVSVEEIQADRFMAAKKIQEKYNAVVVLKGPGTLVVGPHQLTKICPYGNPGMATAGMGDLLSGIIGGLIAQGLSAQDAAELGCCLHSSAADLLVDDAGYRGVAATDLLPYVHKLLNQECQ
ncbi:MAG: NAD(P)H-hydrate dehydratase [Porticoccaceae bacterium]|nr:NAD(P)H-hydrate dehydratase [Porticoccaceae bacterium]